MEKIAKCPVCNQGDLIEGAKGYMCNHLKVWPINAVLRFSRRISVRK
jgi:hypothetical protein